MVEESNLTVHIATLRKLLGQATIASIPGRSYRLTVPMAENLALPGGLPTLPQPLAHADKPSLAVKPFLDLSGDAGQDYFVDGVVDDIISALSRVRSFFVIARSSSFTYKSRVVDAPQVGS